MPLADAGAREDPLVGGIDGLFQITIRDQLGRQVGTRADDARERHDKTSPGRTRRSPMRRRTPSLTSSWARRKAHSNEKLSAEPWLFTTMPRSPSRLAPLYCR